MNKLRAFLSPMLLILLGVSLAAPVSAATFTNVVVPVSSTWKYWKGTNEASSVPDTKAWRSNSFSDASWTTGAAPFWYGDVQPGGTQLTDMINTYSCIFIRQPFMVTDTNGVGAVRLSAACDDGFIAWINGVEVYRFNMPAGDPVIGTFFASTALGDVQPFSQYDVTTPAPSTYLLVGNNTLAVQVFNATLASSDLGFDMSLTVIASETNPPTIATFTPMAGTLTNLTQITVDFSEPVTGVNDTDLLVNGQFASSVSGSGASYTFTFLPPAYGIVPITWDLGHAITDLALPGNPFNATGPGATWQYTLVDMTPPAVASVNPTPATTVISLSSIEVLFSEPVSGVNAGDLLVNTVAAASVTVVTPSQYLFQFPQPNTGAVQVAWSGGHGIQDLAGLAGGTPNPFTGPAGGPPVGWSYVLDTNSAAQVIISEFVADNDNGIRDEDNETSDWIELYNAGDATVYLGNWFLTDDANNLDKWQFPNTNLPPNGFLIVWASEKNKRVAGAPLHTNFKLDAGGGPAGGGPAGGEYLGLVRSNAAGGLEVMWDFGNKYPSQEPNLSYGTAFNVGSYVTLIPGLPGGATARVLVPSGDLGLSWTAPGFVDSGWASVTTGLGFDTGTNYDPGIASDIQAQMLGVNPSAFIRLPFTVADPGAIQDMRLRMRFDDGFVAYLNGIEAARANTPGPAGGAPQWNSSAPVAHGSDSGGGVPTTQDFDVAGTAYATQQHAGAYTPQVLTEGGAGANFLRLANTSGGVLNTIAFARTAAGTFTLVTVSFEFRVTPGSGQADGFGVALMSTALHGTSGSTAALNQLYEEAALAGAVGFGFDVYNNGGGDPNNNHVSLHYNGAVRSTTQATPAMDLSNGQWHRADIIVNFAAGDARVTLRVTPNVRGTPGTTETLYNDYVITGVPAYESRLCFGARTGGETANHDFDNITVQYGAPTGMVPAEEFNLSHALTTLVGGVDTGTLVPGVNVLAIHGLNRAVGDADFFIAPELIGRSVTVQPGSLGYYLLPTSTAPNEGGAAGVAGEPVFSRPGGVYTETSFNVALSTTTPLGAIRYTLDGTTPTAASPLYSVPLAVAISTVVKARVFAAGMVPGRIGVQTYTMLESEADMTNFTSNLPLVIIDTFGQGIPNDNKIPASMVFIDTYRGRSSVRGTPDAQSRAGIEIRGSSSAGFPKNSFGFELRDENTNDAAVSLFGMPAESDWVLYAPYTDKTFMNDYLTYELWDAMGHYAVRRRFVEVFRDVTGGRLTYPGDYSGIYVLLEKIKIDKDRVDIADLSGGDNATPEVTGGYILKRDRFDGNEHTFNVPINSGGGTSVLGVEDPKGAEITTAQKNYLSSWFTQMSNALFGASYTNPTTGYAAWLDVKSFIDHFWLVEMPKNIDGYRLSNFYNKDRNGKLREGPVWDWNLSFGNANYLEGGLTNNYYWTATGDGDYLWYRRLFTDPDFNQKHIDRWQQLRTNVFGTTNLLARVSAVTNLLNEAQTRDFQRWGHLSSYVWPNPDGANLVSTDGTTATWHVNYATMSTYSGLIGEMKRWIEGRVAWIDTGFPARPPSLSLPAGPVSPGTPLTMTAPAGTIYYMLNGTDPRAPGGSVAPGALTYSGPVTITTNVGAFARARVGTGANSWSGPTLASYVIETPKLLVTEIMYHPDPPPPGSTNVDEDFEYIEIKNNGAAPINLLRSRISGGVDVELPNYLLHPGCYVVVVAQTNAFLARYGNVPVIVGSFTDRLENDGGHIVFEGPVREPIHDFTYSDGWEEITDGLGFSLVPVNENTPLSNWVHATSWRASGALHGSPGTNDAAPVLPVVVINEALTHTDLPQIDAIELRNLSGGIADISDWYLTDDFGTPQKYRFPPGTTIPFGSQIAVYETSFNAGPNAFTLSSLGDEVYLFSGDAAGNLTGYYHGFDFGPQFNGVSFGRHVTSEGEDHFVAQSAGSLGSANSAPRVGPVAITEIHYHPPDVQNPYGVWDDPDSEYIELRNISGSTVELYHPTNSALVWKLRDAVDYSFPPGTTIPASSFVLVVSFDPANVSLSNAFKANYSVPNGVPFYGPWSGKLDNSSDSVELVRPDNPEAGATPYVLADKVRYAHDDPWPLGADGLGPSLQRVVENDYGNDSANWFGGGRSPGGTYVPGPPPVISQHPQSQTVVVGSTAMFSVTASPLPLTFQWRRNGSSILNATNSLLTLPNAQVGNSGQYQCIVLSPSGYAASSNATLTVAPLPAIGQQPATVDVRVRPDPSADVLPNTNAVFSVAATSGSPPLLYQWRFNGTNLTNSAKYAGATNLTLTVSNVTIADYGPYACAITDGVGTIVSSNAILYPLVRPSILIAPISQTVPASNALSVSVVLSNGFPPPFGYHWFKASANFTSIVSDLKTNFLLIPGGFISNNASSPYGLRPTNRAQTAFIASNSTTFTIMTIVDTDRDGMPDAYEQIYAGNTTGFDPAADPDGDGASNLEEYRAGTDPTDPTKYLKVISGIVPGTATVSFLAASNHTYTVLYTDALPTPAANWSKLADVVALRTNRVETMTDPAWISNRFYRAVTPQKP